MGRAERLASVLAVMGLLAGCGASGAPAPGGSATSPASTPTPTTAPTQTVIESLSAAPTLAPTTAPTNTATPRSTESGPTVLASILYPYRISVPSGPTSFVPAPAPWDGQQVLGTDTRLADRARVPGVGAVWLAMTDTADPLDAVARDIEAKFRRWHGCKPATGRRSFAHGELEGVAWVHSCGETYVRAVVVGDGHVLVAYAPAGTDANAAVEHLVALFDGLEWTSGS
jgi:hypothetical protein